MINIFLFNWQKFICSSKTYQHQFTMFEVSRLFETRERNLT